MTAGAGIVIHTDKHIPDGRITVRCPTDGPRVHALIRRRHRSWVGPWPIQISIWLAVCPTCNRTVKISRADVKRYRIGNAH